MNSIPHFDCELNPRDVRIGAKRILATIRPDWDIDRVTFKRCAIGFINHVMTASTEGCDDKVIFRIFGGDYGELLDKDRQKTATLLLNELKISPPVLCIFENGICFEYVKGLAFDWNDFSALDDIRIAKAHARELARFHCNATRDCAINKYKIKERNFVNNQLDTLLGMYPSKEEIQGEDAREFFEKFAPSKAVISREIEELKKMLDDMKLPLVFCHNDANATNSIYNRENDKCTLVDYDMAGFGYAGFDLALFLKFMCFDLFITLPPDSPRCQPKYRKEVLLEYLTVRCKLDGEDEGRALVLFDRCHAQVRKMYLVVCMVFTIYCIIDATLKEVHLGTPIEYLKKAMYTYNEHYVNCKEELMELPVPELLLQ